MNRRGLEKPRFGQAGEGAQERREAGRNELMCQNSSAAGRP